MQKKNLMMFKRMFDFCFAIVLLPFIIPLIIICWIIASFETKSNGFFCQDRVGQYGKIFKVIKIKTLYNSKEKEVRSSIISEISQYITKSGKVFRKYKLDEFPQIFNILVGQMSFVGPRPDIPGYADKLEGEDRIILELKPGITGPASIKYKNEENLLLEHINPQEYNDKIIWPDKVRINKEYYLNYSFYKDIYYIFKTIVG